VESWTAPSATATARLTAATAVASRGIQGMRVAPCCKRPGTRRRSVTGGICLVTAAAVSTRALSRGGGAMATAMASEVAVSARPRTSLPHGRQRRR